LSQVTPGYLRSYPYPYLWIPIPAGTGTGLPAGFSLKLLNNYDKVFNNNINYEKAVNNNINYEKAVNNNINYKKHEPVGSVSRVVGWW